MRRNSYKVEPWTDPKNFMVGFDAPEQTLQGNLSIGTKLAANRLKKLGQKVSGIANAGWDRGRVMMEKTKKARRITAAMGLLALSTLVLESGQDGVPSAKAETTAAAIALSVKPQPKHILPRQIDHKISPYQIEANSHTPIPAPKPGQNKRIASGELSEQRQIKANAEARAKRAQANTERNKQISEIPYGFVGTIELDQTGGVAPNIVMHSLLIGTLPPDFSGTPTAQDFDSGMTGQLMHGAVMHTYGANVLGVDPETDDTPTVIAMHHMTAHLTDPMFPASDLGLRYPEYTRIADPSTGAMGDILTINLLGKDGNIRKFKQYEAVSMVEVNANDPAQVFKSKHKMILYNCSQTPEEIAAANANPGQHLPVEHRMAIFFDEITNSGANPAVENQLFQHGLN